MRFQLGIQLLLIVVAVAIVFGVIKPKLASISVEQNEVVSYRSALENIGRYNQRLQTLLNQANSMSASDRRDLFEYLPEEIDITAVSGDIYGIVERNRLLVIDISFDELTPITVVAPEGALIDPFGNSGGIDSSQSIIGELGEVETGLYSQKFKVSVVGSYEQIKNLLKDFEKNSYPLRIVELSFSNEVSNEIAGLTQYLITLETYSLPGV